MTAPTSHDAPDRSPVDMHIKRKVAASALRRIGALVTDFDHQDRAERRNARIALIVLLILSIGAGAGVVALTMKRSKEPARIVFAAAQPNDALVSLYAQGVDRRLGSLAHDDAARKLQGTVTLDVSVRYDGTIERLDRHGRSDQQGLYEAAESLVRRAAPFEPFPDALRNRADVLVIKRTFSFP